MLYVAVRAARKAGDVIARAFDEHEDIRVEEKQDRDFVTNIDRRAEQIIIREIQRHYPDHGIVAEESERINPNAAIQWYIDPLDGTTNFVHGIPHFAVCIAAWKNDKPFLAVVHDPIKNETFEAQAGNGAFLNRRRLRVSQCTHIGHAVFASGLPPYRRKEMIDEFQKRMDICMRNTEGYRRGGSAALDLAYVAAGRVDAYWEAGLCSWDIAAGILLIQESGGIVTAIDGRSVDVEKGDVLCANGSLHREFVKLLKSAA